MPTLADYGEDRLIAALLAQLPPAVRRGPGIIAGAGDDCAVVNPSAGTTCLQLLKTDCVIEGVHYAPGTRPEQVGWKALCRPLSDIAAMGGTPLHALVTLALPATATVRYAEGIYAGVGRAAERYGVSIVGGETARSPAAGLVSVVLTGTVDANRMVTRSGGKAGHSICVTGRLGGSFAGGKHLDFDPRLDESRWLVEHFPISAMMDLSDGLARDLPRLATASGIGYAVETASVPLTPGSSVANALSDGEDYELLFTVNTEFLDALEESWRNRWPELKLTQIGELKSADIRSGLGGAEGFDHFTRPD